MTSANSGIGHVTALVRDIGLVKTRRFGMTAPVRDAAVRRLPPRHGVAP
ncbi:hypothetical protein [Streptomyces swartbergensis]